MVNVRDCDTVPVIATVSSVIILVVMIPVSPNVPAMESIELVADDGLIIVVEPLPCEVALAPISI